MFSNKHNFRKKFNEQRSRFGGREAAKKLVGSEKKAEDLTIIPGQMEAAEPIHTIQKVQGHNPSSKESDGQSSDNNCCFTQESFGEPASECEINDWPLPTLDLEQYEPNIEKETGVQDKIKGSTRYAWIGAGQCGGRLVKSFYDLGYRKVLAVDTTHHDLDLLDIPKDQKFLMDIGEKGAGKDMERGKKAVQQNQQEILHLARQIFGTQVDHVMISFGGGGGTGSGSVAGLIEVAKRYARYIRLEDPSKRVGVVMTLPAVGKVGSKVAENAHKVACQLSQMATGGEISPLIIVDNDKINKMYPRMAAKSFWPSINSTVASLFDTFNTLSALSSQYTSFDPLDYHSIMQAGGCAIMGLTKVDKFDNLFAISEAVEKNFDKMLFAGGFDLSTAKEAGCIVVGGKDLMTNVKGLQDNIDYAFDALPEITGQATIHRGIYEDNRDCLRVYTIIGGLDSPTARLEKLGSDLYYRLNTVNLQLQGPPLHQRKEDILPLAEHFLAKQADLYSEPHKFLSSEAQKLLSDYAWPGNIRELANAIEHAYILTTDQEIQPAALPFEIIFADSEPSSKQASHILDETRRNIITRALEFTEGRKLAAAKILGIEHRYLNRLIKKLNISLTDKNIVIQK